MTGHDTEIERIRAAYRERDASPAAPASGWSSPAYRFYMQQLEWELLEALGQAGATPAGRRVLEVGCGSGYFLHRLAEYGAAHAAGIDLMEDRIAQARRRYPTLELVAGDASALPWQDASFDVVTQFTCLSSVLDPVLRASIAREMWRVLAPGGVLVSYDMRTPPALVRAPARLRSRGIGSGGPVTPTTPIDALELARLFPSGSMRRRTVSLDLQLAGLATRGRWLAAMAALMPFLRTHLLATVRKPA